MRHGLLLNNAVILAVIFVCSDGTAVGNVAQAEPVFWADQATIGPILELAGRQALRPTQA